MMCKCAKSLVRAPVKYHRYKDMNCEWGKSQASHSERERLFCWPVQMFSESCTSRGIGPPLLQSYTADTQMLFWFQPWRPMGSPWQSHSGVLLSLTLASPQKISNAGHMGTETMDNIFHMFTRCWRSQTASDSLLILSKQKYTKP